MAGRHWEQEEIKYLDNYPEMTIAQIARALGRPYDAVKHKLIATGRRKPSDRFKPCEITRFPDSVRAKLGFYDLYRDKGVNQVMTKYKPTTIKLVQQAIEQAGSIELDKVCQMLEDMMIERVRTTMKITDEERIANKATLRLIKAGIKSTKDVRAIILQLEKVRI